MKNNILFAISIVTLLLTSNAWAEQNSRHKHSSWQSDHHTNRQYDRNRGERYSARAHTYRHKSDHRARNWAHGRGHSSSSYRHSDHRYSYSRFHDRHYRASSYRGGRHSYPRDRRRYAGGHHDEIWWLASGFALGEIIHHSRH